MLPGVIRITNTDTSRNYRRKKRRGGREKEEEGKGRKRWRGEEKAQDES